MSRDKKRQFNWYQPNDSEAIARHLEKMAAKGWFLEKVTNSTWLFRRGEPRTVHYTVTYYPEASVFDAEPAERQSAYIDFCRAAGWEFVAARGPIQYFRSDLPNPVPIETDEEEKLRVVRKTMRKTMVLGYGLLIFAQLIWIWQQWHSFRYSPLSTVSSAVWPALMAFYLVFLFFLTAILADYFLWCLRSARSVARGGACVKVHTKARLLGSYVLVGALTVFLLFYLSRIDLRMRVALLCCAVGLAAVMGISRGVMWLLKRRGCARGTVRGGFIASVIVLSIVYVAGMAPLGAALSEMKYEEDVPVYTWTSPRGVRWDIYRDELPVTLEDLGWPVEEEDHCSYQAIEQHSVLASYGRYIQQSPVSASSPPYLDYTVCRIPSDALRDFCWRTLSQNAHYPGMHQLRYPDVMDTLPEGALEGRCNSEYREYALLYPDRIVLYDSGWDLTQAQLETLLEALG